VARPNRALILDHLGTSLAAIAGDGDVGEYKLTAITVDRAIYDPQAMPLLSATTGANATPWFGYVPAGAERIAFQSGGILTCTLPIIVSGAVAFLPGAGGALDDAEYRAELVSNIMDDITYALCGTAAISSRGTHTNDAGATVPNAIQTIIIDQWGDDSHETAEVTESGYIVAQAYVRAEVTYQRTRGHS
jgi:hypothetical protein